jgi:hypothetical protein
MRSVSMRHHPSRDAARLDTGGFVTPGIDRDEAS